METLNAARDFSDARDIENYYAKVHELNNRADTKLVLW